MRPPSDRFLRDRLLFYPRVKAQGVRGGPQDAEGTPVEGAGSVQVAELSSNPVHDVQDATRRRGQDRGLILLAGPPPVPIDAGYRIDHVGILARPGRAAVTFAAPDVYRAVGRPIPPGGGRARWTVAVERDT